MILRSVAFGAPRKRARVAILMSLAVGAALLSASAGSAASAVQALSARTSDNGNGSIDAVRVTFSGLMNVAETPAIADGPNSPGMWVDGYTIASLAWVQGDATTLHVGLTERAAPDTGATPIVRYTSGAPESSRLESVDGEELASFSTQALDGAGPVLVRVTSKDVGTANMFNAFGERLDLVFSEPISLAGATKKDKWLNLEQLVQFTKHSSTLNCRDGDGVSNSGTAFNFPQPGNTAGTADDPIEIAGGGTTVRVTAKVGNTLPASISGANQFRSVPVTDSWCKAGVHPSNTNLIVDGAGNFASHQNRPATGAQSLLVYPADIDLASAKTLDRDADASIDAVELTFGLPVKDATVSSGLGNLSIAVGDAAATIASFDTGTAADDATIVVPFTQPDGAAWGTGVTPAVAYTKPAGCGGESGSGIRGEVVNPGYWACVASFAVTAQDGAAPKALSARTGDDDADGSVDRVVVTFSEPVSGTTKGWTVDGVEPAAFSTSGSTAVLAITEAETGDGDRRPAIAYTAPAAVGDRTADAAGNQIVGASAMTAADGVAPRIRAASVHDANADGTIDRVVLTYSESMPAPSGGSAGAFTVGGVTASGISTGASADDATLELSVASSGTGPKEIVFSAAAGSITDAAGNASTNQTIAPEEVVDAAAPVGTISISQGAPMSAGTKTVVVTYGEAMDTAVAPTVTLGATAVQPVLDLEHTNGWRNDDPSRWEGSIEVAEGDCTVATGCPVTLAADGAADVAGNAQAAAATLETEIDTIAPSAPTAGAFTATQTGSASVPARTLNRSSTGFSLQAGFPAAEAAGGRAEILLDGEPLSPAARSAVIGASDTSATATTAFASVTALRTAVQEGTHALAVRLCDDAANCSTSANVVDITADYTAVDVDVVSPSAGAVVQAGTPVEIVWEGEEVGDFSHLDLAYTTGGSTWTTIVTNRTTIDGTYEWEAPFVSSQTVRIRATTVDTSGNRLTAVSGTFAIHIPQTFEDVTPGHWAYEFVQKLYAAEVTTGCKPGRYCPNANVTRAQMAAFILRALGHDDHLPAYKGTFSDVPQSAWYARYVEHLHEHGITTGCGGGKYCPNDPVTRGQMAAFILRAIGHDGHLAAYKGTFADVPQSAWYARHVEHLYDHEVTGGCAQNPLRYCPGASVTRAQMAKFLVLAFGL